MSTPRDKLETRFEAQGSLRPPGAVSRLVRLLFWLFVLIALHVTPYVVNIGFGVSSRRKPQHVVLALPGS